MRKKKITTQNQLSGKVNPIKLYTEFYVLSQTFIKALTNSPIDLVLKSIQGQLIVILKNIPSTPNACKGCGSQTSKPLPNEKGQLIYWFGAMKDTKDFKILTSALEIGFLTSTSELFPTEKLNVYDFYCSKCFEYIMDNNEPV